MAQCYYASMNLSLNNVIVSDPETLGGVPVFSGTRVPFRNLIDCLESGDSIDLFLYDFPTVSREQVIAVLETAKDRILGLVA
jgi:uncharacterized protein (DUF433 family)